MYTLYLDWCVGWGHVVHIWSIIYVSVGCLKTISTAWEILAKSPVKMQSLSWSRHKARKAKSAVKTKFSSRHRVQKLSARVASPIKTSLSVVPVTVSSHSCTSNHGADFEQNPLLKPDARQKRHLQSITNPFEQVDLLLRQTLKYCNSGCFLRSVTHLTYK